MSVEDYAQIARAARKAGVTAVKLTGGEPTIYRASDGDVVDVVRAFREAYAGAALDLSMTTNGLRLARQADRLKQAGLDRVTVSLTTLRASLFRDLLGARRGSPENVLAGLDAAISAGLSPLKVNMVIFTGGHGTPGNLDEILPIIEVCRQRGVAELRLYPLLGAEADAVMQEKYTYWDVALKSILIQALPEQEDDETRSLLVGVLDDAIAGKFDKLAEHARFTLRIGMGQLSVALNMMRPDRTRMLPGESEAHRCQEGVYAVRLAANGDLRICLEQPPVASVRNSLRSEASVGHLVRTLISGREAFRAHHGA